MFLDPIFMYIIVLTLTAIDFWVIKNVSGRFLYYSDYWYKCDGGILLMKMEMKFGNLL